MYVLFLDGGPLMVVQSYEEDDLKKKKKTNKNRPSFIKYCLGHSSYFNQPIYFISGLLFSNFHKPYFGL